MQRAGCVSALGCPQTSACGAHPTNGRMRASGRERRPNATDTAAPPATAAASTRARRTLPAAFETAALVRCKLRRVDRVERLESSPTRRSGVSRCARGACGAVGEAGGAAVSAALGRRSRPRRDVPLRRRDLRHAEAPSAAAHPASIQTLSGSISNAVDSAGQIIRHE